jgi:hypothetical protein
VVVGGDELLVLGGVRRDVGRGAALLFLVVLEVAAQARLALGLVLALELVRDVLRISVSGSMPLAWIERPAGV